MHGEHAREHVQGHLQRAQISLPKNMQEFRQAFMKRSLVLLLLLLAAALAPPGVLQGCNGTQAGA